MRQHPLTRRDGADGADGADETGGTDEGRAVAGPLDVTKRGTDDAGAPRPQGGADE